MSVGDFRGFTLQRLDPDPKSESDIDRLDTIWTDLEELTPGPLAQWEPLLVSQPTTMSEPFEYEKLLSMDMGLFNVDVVDQEPTYAPGPSNSGSRVIFAVHPVELIGKRSYFQRVPNPNRKSCPGFPPPAV
ncbi:hypothetical protein C366_05307, partial [Cryptococcus neoformans Tu401-1]